MNEIKRIIHEDLYRYSGANSISWIKQKRLYGWQYTRIWRKANYYRKRNKLLFLVYGFLLYRKSKRYGFQVSPHAAIGKGFYLGHFGTVIVSDKTVIGDNVNLSPGVIIGRTNRGSKKGDPTIGSNVWVGGNAVIVGGVTIGDNVLIAPNAYVNQSIPSDSIVIGNPCSVIHNVDATKDYINNTV